MSATGPKKAINKSKYDEFKNGRGAIIADIPSMTNVFIIFEPIKFQTAISEFPFLAAMIEVTISGILVPIATIVSPIIDSLSQNILAISTAPCTRIFQPKKRIQTHKATHKIAFHVDFITSISW